MKRLTITVLFSLVFLVVFGFSVSAVTCNPNQEIIALSDVSNAHGEIPGQNHYSEKICYTSVFGSDYNGVNAGSGVTNCIDQNSNGHPENLVLRLSDVTNAHGEAPLVNPPNYDQDVCYGDLVCRARAGGCVSPEVEVVQLYSNTNSHLAKAGQNYGTSICCTTGNNRQEICGDGDDNDGDGQVDEGCGDPSQCTLSRAYWADNNGNELPDNSNVMENSPVQLVLEATSSSNCGGLEVDYAIRETDVISSDTTPFGGTASFNGNKAVLTWNAVWTEDDVGTSDPEYYFNATLHADPNKHKNSNTIIVIQSGNPEPPSANITAPKHRGIYFNDTTVTFDQNPGAGVNPNSLEYLWTIEHEDSSSETFTDKSFQYHFKIAGQDTITLRVTDPATDLSSEDQIAVVVVASPGVLAYINQPRHLELVPESILSNRPRLLVDYNASDSFVVNNNLVCTNGVLGGSVTCLAGNCPSSTQNAPPGCEGQTYNINPHNIGWVHTSFAWAFGDGDTNTADEINGVTQRKLFGLNSAGTVTTDLDFSYDDGATSLDRDTSRTFELGQCIDNGNTWRFAGSSGQVWYSVSTQSADSLGACKGIDGLTGTADDCCANGLVCGDPGDGNIRCFDDSSDDGVSICQDYTAQSNCLNDSANILENNPGYSQTPPCGTYYNGNIVECSCSWTDLDSSGQSSCFFNKTYTNSHNPDDGGDNCVYNYTYGACESGYRSVQVDANWFGNPGDETVYGCQDDSLIVLCGSPSVDLGFFDIRQFIAALISVFIIYYFITRFDKEKKK